MSFIQAKKNLIKIFALICILCFTLCGCENKELPEHQDTNEGTVDGVSFVVTSEESNFVKLEMVNGDIMIIQLYPEGAPITVKNFKKLVSQKFYDGLVFHRISPNFVIQTGDPTGLGSGGSKETIFGEFGINGYSNPIPHEKGTLSMARLGHDYDSASSQIFICLNDETASQLNGSYASFGKVIAGMSTVDKIGSTPVQSERPVQEQRISSIRFVTVTQ
ncbi:MAG: peptidylprolyl isomerase [Clostridia bacterium]|nr:peptidylprolyl isomerase [Clostridia bacterium]